MILQASTPKNGLKHSNRFLSVFDNFVGLSLKGLKLNQTSLTKHFCKNSFRTFILSGLLRSSHSEKKIPLNRLFKVSNEQSYQNILLMFFRGLYSNLNIKNLRKRAFIKISVSYFHIRRECAKPNNENLVDFKHLRLVAYKFLKSDFFQNSKWSRKLLDLF